MKCRNGRSRGFSRTRAERAPRNRARWQAARTQIGTYVLPRADQGPVGSSTRSLPSLPCAAVRAEVRAALRRHQ